LGREKKRESKEEGEERGEEESGGRVDSAGGDDAKSVGAYLEDGSYTCDGLSLGIAKGAETENRRGVSEIDAFDNLTESRFGGVGESVFGPAVSAAKLFRIDGSFVKLGGYSRRFTDSELNGVFSSKRNPHGENSRKKRNIFKEGE